MIWKMYRRRRRRKFWDKFQVFKIVPSITRPTLRIFQQQQQQASFKFLEAPKAPKIFGIFQDFKFVPSITRPTLDIFQQVKLVFQDFGRRPIGFFRFSDLADGELAIAARVWGIVDWAGAKLVLPGPDFLVCF